MYTEVNGCLNETGRVIYPHKREVDNQQTPLFLNYFAIKKWHTFRGRIS